MKIGLHLSTQGNPVQAITSFEEAGGQAAQIFPGNPRRFGVSKPPGRYEGEIPVIVHATYVINLADPKLKTRDGAVDQLVWAEEIGADYFVYHAGSSKKHPHHVGTQSLRRELDVLLQFKKDPKGKPWITLENTAQGRPYGTKGSMGRVETLLRVIECYDPLEVSICYDTAHAWACGEDMRAIASVGRTSWIRLVHANVPNPEVGWGSRRDRHDVHQDDGAYSTRTLAQILAAMSPDVAIIESQVHTVQDCEHLNRQLVKWRKESIE